MGLWLGICAFALFFLSDYNDWHMKHRALRVCFPLGTALLAGGTLLRCGIGDMFAGGWLRVAVLAAAAAFFLLLLYTLLFAIPREASYARPGERRSVCTTGVYALCRHPGVLWFVGLYGCLWVAAGLPLWEAAVYSGLNVLLVLFEDRCVFPARLEGYREYQRTTPFLLPDRRSIRACRK